MKPRIFLVKRAHCVCNPRSEEGTNVLSGSIVVFVGHARVPLCSRTRDSDECKMNCKVLNINGEIFGMSRDIEDRTEWGMWVEL